MGKRLIQHGAAILFAQGALVFGTALAQVDDPDSAGSETEAADSIRSPMSALRDLLLRPHDDKQLDEGESSFGLDTPPRAAPNEPSRTIGAPLRKRKGGLWSFDERWSLGLGLMRAGEPRPENNPAIRHPKESMWLDVAGTDGSVHVFDAGLNWSIDPLDDVQVSIEGGLRTLAQSEPAAAHAVDHTPIDLDGSLITQPVMGASVRWSLTDWAYIEGSATGNVTDVTGSFLDLTAQAGVDLTARTGLVAGYRYLDASFDSAGNSATLNQDVLFAGLQIRY